MSDGKEFHKVMCREGDCLMSGCNEFHKLICRGWGLFDVDGKESRNLCVVKGLFAFWWQRVP